MSKITPTEIKQWSEFFWKFIHKYVDSANFKNLPDKEQEKAKNMLVAAKIEAEKGNTVPLFILTELFDQAFIEELPAEIWRELSRELGLDNFETSFAYADHIKKRLVEHHVARGYYSPNSPLSLEEWKNKKVKVGWGRGKKFETDRDYRNDLFVEMNEEDREFIWRVYSFFTKMNEVQGDEDEGEKLTEKTYQRIAFYLEDIVKTLEAAQVKLEQKKSSSPVQPPLSDNSRQRIIDHLTAEKQRLEQKVKELENQPTSQDQSEQKLKDQQLAELNRQIREKEAEVERIKKQKQSNQPTKNQNNNSDLTKLAIGLSIVAIVIGVLALLVWLVKPRKRTD